MISLPRFFASFVVGALVLFPCNSAISYDPAVCSTYPTNANPRRIAGRQAEPDSRPWIVLVWITCEGEEVDSLGTCEGALIRNQWVLTVANCFPCGSTAAVVVDVGLHNSDVRAEIRHNRSVERVGVDGIFMLPDFEYPSANGDLALLHLNREVKNATRVVSLVDCGSDRDGRVGVSSGWGKIPSKARLDPKPLQDAYIAVWTSDECEQMLGGDKGGMLCAGSMEHVVANVSQDEEFGDHSRSLEDPCYVEWGSPLVLSEPKVVDDESGAGLVCEWKLLGVLSFGLHCSGDEVEEVPGFYTSVCEYRGWIEDTIEKENARLDSLRFCPALPHPPVNGYLCTPPSSAPGMVQFCCKKGYSLSGNSMATCNLDTGKWEPDTPNCQPVECPPVTPPPHGFSTPPDCSPGSFQMGCWFSCEEGYHLTGSSLLTCGETGEWSQSPPNCQVVSCGNPLFAGNLEVRYSSVNVNATAVYSCKKCFKMADGQEDVNGTLERRCDASGQWIGPLPICKVVKCPPLPPPLNGSVLPATSMCGARVRFACDPGFNLIGVREAECLGSGEWSDPAPTCGSVACPPPRIADSNLKHANASYGFGAVLEVECDWCRVMVEGEAELTCTAGGEWDKPLPKCQWATCPLPGFLAHGQISPLGQLYFCGTTVRFRCERGYWLEGTESCTCQLNGTWSHLFPSCRRVSCGQLEVPLHGSVQQHNGSGLDSTANFSCDTCYSLRGAPSLTCLESGEWDHPPPTCEPLSCPRLKPLQHGQMFPSPETNGCQDTVFFSCAAGYNIRGPLAVTCEESGEWSNEQPQCEVVTCKLAPPPSPHSHICHPSSSSLSSPSPFNTSLRYCCDEGYRMEAGHSGIVGCNLTGEWNATAPLCQAITCETPISPENGNITQNEDEKIPKILPPLSTPPPSTPPPSTPPPSTPPPSTPPPSTPPPFTPPPSTPPPSTPPPSTPPPSTPPPSTPPPSTPPPSTPPPSTPPPSTPPHALPYGTRLTFHCDEGYTLVGAAAVNCTGEGVWSHRIPSCENTECTYGCRPPVAPRNGRVANILQNGVGMVSGGRGKIMLGAVAVFICTPGYYLHGSGSRKCVDNHIWTGQQPMCLPFEQPRSRFIFRDPSDRAVWLSTDSTHFLPTQPLYMACQTHMEDTGVALPITKIEGPQTDPQSVKIREYGNPARSTQLALQPRTAEGGHTMAGTYLCQVHSSTNTSIVVNRTLTVYIHATLCPSSPSPRNGALTTSGTTPGSCLHYKCNNGYTFRGSNNRLCLSNGTWSGAEPFCVSRSNLTCTPPPTGRHASLSPPPTATTNGTQHYDTGDVITYHCPPSHTLTGKPQRTCLGANIWSGTRPTCVVT